MRSWWPNSSQTEQLLGKSGNEPGVERSGRSIPPWWSRWWHKVQFTWQEMDLQPLLTESQTAWLQAHQELRMAEEQEQSHLVRDVFGLLPFREVRLDSSLLNWNDGTVRKLAQAV